jgi:hypothetical protein
MSYGDYVEQPTYLSFLKMADELFDHNRHTLKQLRASGKKSGGFVFFYPCSQRFYVHSQIANTPAPSPEVTIDPSLFSLFKK